MVNNVLEVGGHIGGTILGLHVNIDTMMMSWITMGILVSLCLIALVIQLPSVQAFLERASTRFSWRHTAPILVAMLAVDLLANMAGLLQANIALGIMIGLCVVALLLHGRHLGRILEATYSFLHNMVTENMPAGAHSSFYFIGTLFLFILFSNMLGLLPVPGFKSPTSDVNVTLALALLVLAATFYYGCKVRGIKEYILSYFRPSVVFFPIHLLDMLVKPFSLAFRLFGNIFAGEVLLVILYFLVPVVVPTVWLAASIFIGVIQAYLFAMLSIAYISAATNH